ncbi:MAG: hypothetical protein AAGI08_02630 [Bacteroidota bacterium]
MKYLLSTFALAFVLLAGCNDGELEALRQENQQLVQSFEQATRIIDDVQQNLARIEEREGIINQLQLENEGSPSGDVEERIQTSLSAIDAYLEENRRKLNELNERVEGTSGELNGLRGLVASLERQVKEKEQEVQGLRTENRELQSNVATLQNEVETRSREVEELGQTVVEQDSLLTETTTRLDETETALEAELEAAATAYFVVGDRDGLEQRGVINVSRGGFLGLGGKRSRIADIDPTQFSPIQKSQNIVQLGPGIEDVEVLSAHKEFSNLYEIEQAGSSTALRITDPERFWSVSEYLVVMVKD